MQDIMDAKVEKDSIRMKVSSLFIATFILLAPIACKKNSNTPTSDFFNPVYVYQTVDLTFAQYTQLNNLQGYVYLTGGNKGIILYHTIDDQFVAFDRTCPVRPDSSCAYVSVDSVPTRYRCGQPGSSGWKICCHSLFDAAYGTQLSGEATRGLKTYYTMKQGSVVYVSSNPF